MPRTRKEKRFYTSVAASSIEAFEYTVPNGSILTIEKVGGNASISPETVVQIIWDEGGAQEGILLSTHGDAVQDIYCCGGLVGDGTRKLKIKLKNDQDVADIMGGFYMGYED
jgi:hypothetical protein